MCGQHHWPVWGQERIDTMIREQRDLYKYAHDQTIRLMNHGLNAAEIAETIRLPPQGEAAYNPLYVLGQALRGYPHCLGSAGALFGLLYYLLIGAAMALVGAVQLLAPTLIVCGLLALWLQRDRSVDGGRPGCRS